MWSGKVTDLRKQHPGMWPCIYSEPRALKSIINSTETDTRAHLSEDKMVSCAAHPGAAWGNLVGLITAGLSLSHTISEIGVNNIILINVHKCQQTLAHSECRLGGGRWGRWRGGGRKQSSHCHWSTNAASLDRLYVDDQCSVMATEEETANRRCAETDLTKLK